MLLDNFLNTQFVPHRKHNNLIYKDHPIMLLKKLTAVYCQSYEVQKHNVCVKCTHS
jgi:hypothetical protein